VPAKLPTSIFAAVMTGKGTGAISTIQVFGDSAQTIIKKIFKPITAKQPTFKAGKILLGTINDGTETIDHVTIGCEGPDNFVINCHGNPLIVEMIMQLLAKKGAKLLTAEQLMTKILSAQKQLDTITVEAKLAQPKAKTIQGTKIIANQIYAGLSKKIEQWQKDINKLSLSEISAEANEILTNSQTAKLIIFGCKAAIIGPPNTGKSTLLNYLAGRQKAIVTDIKGTTRDWVSAQCRIEPLYVELFDTAGLDEPRPSEGLGEKLAGSPDDIIEKESQKRSVEIIQKADIALLVLDNSQAIEQLDEHLLEKISSKEVLIVLNKSDLTSRFDTTGLPGNLTNTVRISAKFGTGIENLCEKIRQICGVNNFDLKTPVCFTDRQEFLFKQLKKAKSTQQAASIITELLNGRLSV